MEYRRFDQVCIVRLDPGEDILEEVRAVSLAEGIRLASVQGLGAVDDRQHHEWRVLLPSPYERR